MQGTAGTSEDHLKYGWNYALLIAEGPSATSAGSLAHSAGDAGRRKFARVEEITRTSPEVQDALISILSEKQIAIPELNRNGQRAARLQHHRDRQHPRPGRERDERGAQAPIQLRHGPGSR